ncbi:MAG: VCBS repeat-containing protein, partial [Anaerolineae bacterium]|nr:VCBS repeat-containing protein [Anaerolineae bacterium]
MPHITRTHNEPVQFYEGNGSGLGINDLNNDGLLDIVLGNLKGTNTILWNEGNLEFHTEEFARNSRTRAVTIVDTNADGWLDIVLTTQLGAPSVWYNNGDDTFTFALLDGVNHPAYTLDWGDVDADGDLDLVTASYDAELFQLLRDNFLFNGGAGVYFYENHQGTYIENRLADKAQALAVMLADINMDDAPELIVGNDFSMPDQSWSFWDGSWKSYEPFAVTTFSTMSFDAGDIDNNGSLEFFAADMHPPTDDAETLGAWRYVLDDIASAARLPGDRQIAENMLHIRTTDGNFTNAASDYGIDATGWTWSAKFGDLDQDGYLDLYAVNGMQSFELFPHLPNDALVEPNAAFRNNAGKGFELMPSWGLG